MGEGDAAGTIRVLLADDDAPFLEALSPLIERQPELAVVGTAGDLAPAETGVSGGRTVPGRCLH